MVVKSEKKEMFKRVKPHVTIGTIGHVDHGKTTLTSAITQVLSFYTGTKILNYDEIDKTPEERARGITINALHVEYETETRHYTHVDCPGHQDFMKNMIIGAIQMDGVILVVALTDGPQEQTREHIILISQVGIKNLVAFFNKLDAILDPNLKDLVSLETLELLETYGYEDVSFAIGSAAWAMNEVEEKGFSEKGHESVKELMRLVDEKIPLPVRNKEGLFIMPIEDIYTIQGRGTVVSGCIEQGTVKSGQELELVGSDTIKTTCYGVEMFHKIMNDAIAGENVGVLIKGVKRKQVERGMVLCDINALAPKHKFKAQVYILTRKEGGRKKPFSSGFQPQFFFRTSNITGTIKVLNEDEVILPGAHEEIEVKLMSKVALNMQLKFTIREGTNTVGKGKIIEIIK